VPQRPLPKPPGTYGGAALDAMGIPRAAFGAGAVTPGASALRARSELGSVALSLCNTARPLHTRFTKIVGASISETTVRPNPRSELGGMTVLVANDLGVLSPRLDQKVKAAAIDRYQVDRTTIE
jgi:hypothetical protein